ncbi:MAG TPA: wax ester/triacylglycerol synthase family O-acyltransferase [Kofleriaceae bacterium]|nr:wax ester/triacylglycerol synthase family O-acyltransferase [Kofleriaceae bacterium]
MSALDASFLDVETRSSSMSVGAVLTFGPGPLVGPNGEVDIDRLRAHVGAAVESSPRYRQRIARVPGIGQPVWIDDDEFVLDFHLRHTRLPYPGTPQQLDDLVGVLFSQRIDRDHPLWSMWVVEGLAGGGFAIVMKAHHCMVDGVGGADLLMRLLQMSPNATTSVATPSAPRPAPGKLELVRGEIRYHNRRALDAVKRAWRALGEDSGGALRGLAQTFRTGLVPAPATPLNPRRIGPHRRFASVRLDLVAMKRVKTMLGGTVNDVALATVAGALRRFLARRGVMVDHLRGARALVPVNTRRAGDADGGNHVALMLAGLPIEEPDPALRLARVRDEMVRLKNDSGQIAGSALATDLADVFATGLLTSMLKLAIKVRAFNVTVTNVPGPPIPMFLLGSKLSAIYPKVPLYETQGVGFALFSYDGGMNLGIAACWHTVPDLHDLVDDVHASFDELLTAAAAASPRVRVVRPAS